MEDIIRIGHLCNFGARGGVFSPHGVSPTLLSGMDHGNTMPFIIEIYEI